ncbi:P-loop containing nucleoside triphosphate hydrolase [Pseudocohnilembus persalinus]|uniref:p-loop containing nucleoside triphosphate hydrolase n=1 Tax=Pseudocohnilembus persalinus TaxID=266149 RepID=A0A0V0QZ19_PSEPJ|nr:P-loop containing nucleoside triphosphate hydrolase [Pseudocohnilembus persalinus]|eukprot:KRX07483.1 P-loop containing nucleoside triphosphate hydrolase [Pseudocohnilembus persalinus]
MNQLQQDEIFQLRKTLTDNFPFKPYDIQVNFAFSLYQALNQHKKLSILESPTGTGKTLSIISGSFQWLLENQFNYKKIQENVMKEENQKENQDLDLEGIPDWLMNAEDFQERNYKICVQKFQDQIVLKKQKFQLFMQNLQDNLQKKGWNKQMIIDQKKREQEKNGNNNHSLQEKEEQILKQYEIDLIQNKQGKNQFDKQNMKNNNKSEFGIQNKNRNQHLNQFQQIQQQEDIFNELERFQIIYASKTHSQISQFVNEIKKTKFGQKFRVITLSSRNQLCLDKQGKEFLREKQDFYQKSQQDFQNKNENENKIHDIEEMKQSAENCEICPYYLSKQAVKYADIICLPYVSLIDEKTRAGFGLNLKNKILIMDEAHNLLDASNQILSNELSFRQVSQVIQELQFYLNKYKSRLKSQNQMYIKQLLSLGQNIFNFMKTQFEQNKKEQSQNQGYKKISNLKFLSEIKIDNFDVFQLQKFIQESRLSHKVIDEAYSLVLTGGYLKL